jgi:hypothetical protein
VTDAVAPLTLGTASLKLTFTRTTMTGSSAACLNIRNSTKASTTGTVTVSCDATDAYVSSTGSGGSRVDIDSLPAPGPADGLAANFHQLSQHDAAWRTGELKEENRP